MLLLLLMGLGEDPEHQAKQQRQDCEAQEQGRDARNASARREGTGILWKMKQENNKKKGRGGNISNKSLLLQLYFRRRRRARNNNIWRNAHCSGIKASPFSYTRAPRIVTQRGSSSSETSFIQPEPYYYAYNVHTTLVWWCPPLSTCVRLHLLEPNPNCSLSLCVVVWGVGWGEDDDGDGQSNCPVPAASILRESLFLPFADLFLPPRV